MDWKHLHEKWKECQTYNQCPARYYSECQEDRVCVNVYTQYVQGNNLTIEEIVKLYSHAELADAYLVNLIDWREQHSKGKINYEKSIKCEREHIAIRNEFKRRAPNDYSTYLDMLEVRYLDEDFFAYQQE